MFLLSFSMCKLGPGNETGSQGSGKIGHKCGGGGLTPLTIGIAAQSST